MLAKMHRRSCQPDEWVLSRFYADEYRTNFFIHSKGVAVLRYEPFFQHDKTGTDRRVAGEDQFSGGGEYPHADGAARPGGGDHKGRFGQIQLSGDPLHGQVIESGSFWEYRKRIPLQRMLGKD